MIQLIMVINLLHNSQEEVVDKLLVLHLFFNNQGFYSFYTFVVFYIWRVCNISFHFQQPTLLYLTIFSKNIYFYPGALNVSALSWQYFWLLPKSFLFELHSWHIYQHFPFLEVSKNILLLRKSLFHPIFAVSLLKVHVAVQTRE